MEMNIGSRSQLHPQPPPDIIHLTMNKFIILLIFAIKDCSMKCNKKSNKNEAIKTKIRVFYKQNIGLNIIVLLLRKLFADLIFALFYI